MLFHKTDLLQNYPLVTLLSQNELDEQKIALAICCLHLYMYNSGVQQAYLVQLMRWRIVHTLFGHVLSQTTWMFSQFDCHICLAIFVWLQFLCMPTFGAVAAMGVRQYHTIRYSLYHLDFLEFRIISSQCLCLCLCAVGIQSHFPYFFSPLFIETITTVASNYHVHFNDI